MEGEAGEAGEAGDDRRFGTQPISYPLLVSPSPIPSWKSTHPLSLSILTSRSGGLKHKGKAGVAKAYITSGSRSAAFHPQRNPAFCTVRATRDFRPHFYLRGSSFVNQGTRTGEQGLLRTDFFLLHQGYRLSTA